MTKKFQSISSMRDPIVHISDLDFSYPHNNLKFYQRKSINKNSNLLFDKINLKVYSGDRVGIYGKNGSGKSTLLKLMANIYHPDSGVIEINGKSSFFLNIFTGINPELTGKDNIKLLITLHGLYNSSTFDNLVKLVADYTELGEALERPMRTYSSGMYIRIPFAIAMHQKGDIYLMDEWLSVGDDSFKLKAKASLDALIDSSSAIVIASQDLSFLKQLCTRLLVFENGKLLEI